MLGNLSEVSGDFHQFRYRRHDNALNMPRSRNPDCLTFSIYFPDALLTKVREKKIKVLGCNDVEWNLNKLSSHFGQSST